MKMKKLNSAGFTLVELLVTCVIISIISLAMAAFLTNWMQGYVETRARTNLLANAENALNIINRDIRLSGSADEVNRWPDANSPSGSYGWSSDSSTLVLAKATLDKDGNIIFSDPNHYITEKDNEIYFIKNNNLYRRTIASDDPSDGAKTSCPPPGVDGCPADQLVAKGATNFSVKYYNANEALVTPTDARSIGLSIELKSDSGGKTITASYSTRMVFRNE